ncbi:Alpha/Beta hydrolase protein [Dactylonectria macrodidyma]|uniref:Alpha/Beta hydrolase protein n=1 Tax=Dactylonectria macrodidyma TaxID=307937 RepID=A0A9P9FPJ2_9HYPO|nr:Alpha/Beta hydrolase protein [Dactylonectria macrodidyma]
MLKFAALLGFLALGSARKCKDIMVPVSLTAENAVFNIEPPMTKIGVTSLFLNMAQQGRDYSSVIQTGTKTVSGDYKLAATYCEPDSGPGKELQIMTHGVGFDRRYWDFPHNNYNYSYVERAVDEHGYSTLTWDRLGIGASSKGHPIDEIQVFLELAALRELTVQATTGKIAGASTRFDRVVHIGHSFGSVMTYALANMYPELTDAIVLTGFSHVFSFLPNFLLGNNFIPVKDSLILAARYPAGYVAPASTSSMQINFFGDGDFDPSMLNLSFLMGQPAAPAELLTVGAPLGTKNTYTGPVMVITGERDLPFCGSDCYATDSVDSNLPSLLDASKAFFPSASRFNATVVPGAGHGLNYGYSHTFTFNAILDFLSE